MTYAAPAPTTPRPADGARRRPAGRWYLLPGILWLLSIVVLAVAITLVYRTVVPDPQPVDPGDRVQVTGAGLTLFQGVDQDGDPTCRLEGDGATVPLSGGDGIAATEGLDLWVVGHTPRSTAAGTYALACDGDPADLYVGRRNNMVEGIVAGVASGLLFIGAVVAWIVLLLRRRRPQLPNLALTPVR